MEPRKRSSRLAQNSPPNNRLLNNPVSHSPKPKEWQSVIEATSDADSANIATDYALLGNSVESLSDEPLTVEEAKKRSDWPQWKQAMDEEIKLLHSIGTWKLEELPSEKSLVSCKWTYRLKHDGDGKITRYKARLITRGFSQVPGMDFFKTYALVVRLDMFRLLMAIAAQ